MAEPTKSMQYRVLLVDDDRDMISLLSSWLKDAGFEVDPVMSGSEAMARIDVIRPHLVITDLVMQGMDGMTLLSKIHRQNPLMPVIMLSGKAQIADAVKAMHLGIAEFLTKPLAKDELVARVRHTLRLAAGESDSGLNFGKEIIYRSEKITQLLEQAKLLAATDVTILITGATGTGKEALAKAIHEGSARKDHPFVAINCAAIPEQLLESELFGHEKGAFTGAQTKHEGLFQAANKGTILLDEVGDMPLSLQVKLLRVLQDFAVRPVGSVRGIPVNVRVISATNTDLEQGVKSSRFREDLYYRLNVVPLHLPPLAERREDIQPLLNHFLKRVGQRDNKKRKRFAPEAVEYLASAPWPGNIRQLMNVVELCCALTNTDIIPLAMAQKALRDQPAHVQTLKDAKEDFERSYLVSVLRVTNGHVSHAARLAGRNRTEFYKLLKQHHIEPEEFRTSRQATEED